MRSHRVRAKLNELGVDYEPGKQPNCCGTVLNGTAPGLDEVWAARIRCAVDRSVGVNT